MKTDKKVKNKSTLELTDQDLNILDSLTGREVEILFYITELELNSKQIAGVLFISVRTVETHRKNIFRKTFTNNLVGLVKFAYRTGLIS